MSIFTKNEKTNVGTNTFSLSHDRKFSGLMGKLIPTLVMDCVPGDKVTLKSSMFTRFAPLIAPVMHQCTAYMHYFFVPNRIIWDDWENFITGGEDGEQTPTWAHITFDYNATGVKASDLADYMGLPVDGSLPDPTIRKVSALPFAAYQRIWYEYYRDQNLQELIDEPQLVQGDNSNTYFTQLRTRSWQHDYFTSALPFTQKGVAATIPLGGEAPIFLKPNAEINANQLFRTGGSDTVIYPNADIGSDGVAAIQDNVGNKDGFIDLNQSHYTDLSSATAATINDLRRAFKLQEWLEKNARGGSRYTESMYAHFGVTSSDARLQRPEFIGGYKAPMKISEVLQLSQTDPSGTPQGNMAGHGVSIGGSQPLSFYAEEHGYIIGIMSMLPKTAYQQGIPRHFLRRDKFDYYWPSFAHIGEQPIEEMEIYQESGEDGTATFGYTPRYAEYKFINSSVHGQFTESLDFWHMGRKFATKPALNEDFILMDYNEIDRIFAVQDDSDHLWCHVLNDIKATRKMPYFGNPKF